MAALEVIHRPPPEADYRARSTYRTAGVALGVVGLMAVMVTLVANIVAAGDVTSDPTTAAQTLAWTFGVTVTGFAVLKVGIAVILVGIIARLWIRVESVKAALARLKPAPTGDAAITVGDVETEWGAATVGSDVPDPLPIHTMARRAWAPMLAMGAMAVAAGLVVSLVQASDTPGTDTFRRLAAWTQGLQFLGEGLLLGGIAFLLGTILYGLRTGGAEVQHSLGLGVVTLKMPTAVKAFVGLMMMGVMVAMAQLVLYVVAASTAGSPQTFAAWMAWLGPLRLTGIGLLLLGIVLSLVAIGNVLAFQFDRITQIVRTGR